MKIDLRVLAALGVAVTLSASNGAFAQMSGPHQSMPMNGLHQTTPMNGPHQTMPDVGHGGHAMDHSQMTADEGARLPTSPGQEAFGAIQEIVAILEADPTTDWSKVDISALREHLVDMNELTVASTVTQRPIAGGLEMTVTGPARAVRAVQNMIPAHAPMIDGMNGWTARGEITQEGAKLTVTAADPKEVQHIRALGFYGLMATGAHHQAHHMAIARGLNPHGQ